MSIGSIGSGLALSFAAVAPAQVPRGEFLPPVRLEAGGAVIDTDVGHAAPFVGDFDGDGVKDLLVGQFGGGLLWFFKNAGTNGAPKLAAGVKWKEGRPEGTVPTG